MTEDFAARPSRARYDKVKTALDLKWRRREPQAERMSRELVDALWDAFDSNPWTWCGLWILQPDGKAFQPGPARPAPAPARAAEGLLADALASAAVKSGTDAGSAAVAVPVFEKGGRVWAVFEAKSSAPFDEMDARWLERLFKIFQLIEKPELPPR